MNTELNGILEQMRTGLAESLREDHEDGEWAHSHRDGEPGESGATNINDAHDVFDFYIGTIIDSLLEAFEMTEEEAEDFVFALSDDMADEGLLDPIPEEAAGPEALALWVGKAKVAMFAKSVMDAADEAAED